MSDQKIRVNMISESEFGVKGHGVHTAYVEITRALSRRPDIEIEVNSKNLADIIHIQTVGFYALLRLLFRRGKKVVSAHLVPDSFIGSIRAARYWKVFGGMWLKFFYGRADLVLACSGMVRDELVNSMKLKNVDLLYNTIDMSKYRPSTKKRKEARKVLGISDDEFVVIGNGQVQPRKRIDTFINIAKAMPDAKFIWVGGIPFGRLGAEYGSMKKIMGSLPDNVTVTGVIDLEDVCRYYLAADVFTLPATQENHPMCVLEAAGSELPIVLRDIPQYDDTFRGHAIMASSDEEFIEQIKKLRSDKQYCEKTKLGSKEIAKRFDSSAGAEIVVDFYRNLLESSE